MLVYATMSNREKVDCNMQQIQVGNSNNYQYISFRNSILDIRLAGLHISNINNVNVWYELLYEVDINERVNYQGKNEILRDTILSMQYKGLVLFIEFEQGSGRNIKNMFVLMTPRL